MTIKPIGKNILITPIDTTADQFGGGLLTIPESSRADAPERGKVMAVGDEVTKVKEGDDVLFNKYSPNDFQLGKDKVLLIEEENILAIVC